MFKHFLTVALRNTWRNKHYSIITTPINNLVGEITKRPDTFRVKAFDDDSKSEELQHKTELLQNYIMSEARNKIMEKLMLEGQMEDVTEEDVEQMTLEQVKDQLDSYTSVAEKWANHILTAQKMAVEYWPPDARLLVNLSPAASGVRRGFFCLRVCVSS